MIKAKATFGARPSRSSGGARPDRERVADALMEDMGYDLKGCAKRDPGAYALARAAYLHFADVALAALEADARP